MQKKMTDEELQRRRAELRRLAGCCAAESEALRARYALDTPGGLAVYESFSDTELLELLRETAAALGRSPAQGEIFWVYRSYLRARFKNWPTALRVAGLSRAAGRGGKTLARAEEEARELQALLDQVSAKAVELGRMPHPSDLPEVLKALRRRYQTWGEVLLAAGAAEASVKTVHPIGDLEPPFRSMLDAIRAQAEALNRAPLRREVPAQDRSALIQRCGSWRGALYQIGLEPVQRISPFANSSLERQEDRPRASHRGSLYDCYYRILRPDQATLRDLETVRRAAQRLGRAPDRHEIPAETRRRLQESCGSWSNALYQLGLQPKKKTKEGTTT